MPDSVLSRRVTISTGPNSPTAPAPSTNRPRFVSSCPASRSTGRSVPSAVVVIADPTSSPDSTTPAAASRPARLYASASVISQPIAASFSGVPRIRSNSIS